MSTPAKKPSGGRPPPRRLFSLDTLKKKRTGSESDAASVKSDVSHWRQQSNASSNLLALAEKIEEGVDPFGDNVNQAWMEKDMTQSPESEDPPNSSEITPKASVLNSRGKVPPPLDLNSTLSTPTIDSNAPLSPSRRRWDTIRSHVIPSASSTRSMTPPPMPTPPPESSSVASTPRPSTPRGYRFGTKKSMRQVVDQARDVVHDETQRLTEEIRKACLAVRFGELQTRAKIEPVTQNTIGSTLHLPFLASTNASVNTGGSGIGHTRQATGGGLKRPLSVMSLGGSRSQASVIHIARALTSSISENRPRTLPCETQVLAALLVPFFTTQSDPKAAIAEYTLAAETFEYLVRTWKPASSEAELDRCIWCCKAASVFSSARVRILGTLSALLFSRDRTFSVETPAIMQTLLQTLFSLLAVLKSSSYTIPEAESVAGYIAAVKDGQSGTPSPQALEKEFGVRYKSDNDKMIREIIVADSVIGCLEVGSEASRRWTLHNLLEQYWVSLSSPTTLTPLLTTMNWRKLTSFINAAISLLSSALPHKKTSIEDANTIIHLLRTRIIPEVEAMQEDAFAAVGEIRRGVVRLVLELLCVRDCNEGEYAVLYLCLWLQDGASWKQSVENSLKEFMANADWAFLLRFLPTLDRLPKDIELALITQLLPPLTDRLTEDPPELPCKPLSDFLHGAALECPKAFFKPVFNCAVSMKDLTIANQLCELYSVARFYPALWTHDPQMMAVALMTDPTSRAGTLEQEGAPAKAKARFGQLILTVELIQYFRQVRKMTDPVVLAKSAKFAMWFENRMGILISAKEQHTVIPPSQRLLFCALLRECRLLSRSLKPASWLPSVVNWTSSYSFHGEGDSDEESDEEEVAATLRKLSAIYEQAKSGIGGGGKRRTTVVGQSASDSHQTKRISRIGDLSKEVFGDRIVTLRGLAEREKSTGLELLVTVSGLLAPDDYLRIAPILWYRHMDDHATHVVASTSFLVMQCAEKIPDEFTGLINDDLKSPDAAVRRKALERIATISSWRFQLLSQEVILDRTYRRPFKLTRPPILFVPTDIGTSLFEMEEDPNDFKDSKGHVLPLELRRRLSEVGWAEERGEMDPKTQWIKTPVSRLPTPQLDTLSTATDGDAGAQDSPSPSPSPEPSPTRLSPRDSPLTAREPGSTTQTKAKRRPVFVATMVSLFPKLSDMTKDSDFNVANTARNLIMDLMRDDPTVLSRSVFHSISGETNDVLAAVTTLRNFLHCESVLPPGMAHHILNHLTGFLKASMKHTEAVNPLHGYGYSSPIIAKLVPQVSKISMRDIRRGKVDMLFVPSGSLWWNDTAPIGPMFPRMLEASRNPFVTLPEPVVWVTMVRTAQNMLMLNMLRRNSQDVKVVRKNLSTLVLPLTYDADPADSIPLSAYIPTKKPMHPSPTPALTALSLTLVRSHLLLLHQVFRSTSRHLNDREELALLLDGLNRIMLAHGDDVGIVAQAMLNYLVASTRFRRLFTSGGGYTLFMPAVIKVYCNAESHPTIRSIIEFAVNRFFALHQESFVFQTCDIMSNVIALPGADGPAMCFNIYTLFATLNVQPAQNAEVAALSALTKVEEQEAIMVTIAERVPQAFLASVHRSSQGKNQVTVDVPEEFDSKRLGLDDLVRLFMTVIAHNPTILRAQQFILFLLFLTPHLYHASASTRSVLRDGVTALGGILLNKGAAKLKGADGNSQIDELSPSTVSQSGLTQASMSHSSLPSDLLVMRLDYLSIVAAFTRAGGHLSSLAAQRVLDIVKIVLKDSRASVPRVASFLADYVRAVLVRPTQPELKETVTLLTDVAPIISSYCSEVDFSGVFDVVATLASDTVFANQPAFARMVVGQYCTAGLEACEVAASAGVLFHLAIRASLLNLLDKALLVVGADIVAELEKREPTYEFLSGVILPLVLRMKTSVELASDSQWAEKWRRDVYSKAWMRLLVYVLAFVQRSEYRRSDTSRTSLSNIERRKSTDSRTGSTMLDPQPALALVVALQVLKVIMTRAEQDISVALPGVWGQIGAILREALADGDASFAIPSRAGYSEPPSPTHSPKATHFNIPDDNPFLTPSLNTSLAAPRTHKRPRILDYMTWSLIEWLCLRRTPLLMQMRIFVQEKVATLHQELSMTSTTGVASGNTSPGGFPFPLPGTRPRSRPTSHIFSKPRRSFLGGDASAMSTPRSSTLFPASVSLPSFDDFAARQPSTPRKAGDDRQPGYQLLPSPLTPSRRAARDSGPKIVHLGPVRPHSPSALGGIGAGLGMGTPTLPGMGDAGGGGGRRSTSPSGRRVARSALSVAREVAVDSPVLVRGTYRRIRVAQAVLGYPALPLAVVSSGDSSEFGMGGGEGMEGLVRAWSRAEALEALVQETKDIIEEWREEGEFGGGEDSGIIVDVEEPFGG